MSESEAGGREPPVRAAHPDGAVPGPSAAACPPADDAAPAAFVDAAREAFADAARRRGLVRRRIRIAGRGVELRFAGTALVPRLLPALAHLAEDGGAPDADAPALTISVFDTRSTGAAFPAVPWSADDCRERGEVRGFNTERFATACNYGANTVSLADRVRRESVFWARDAATLPYYETASPLRTALAWWLESEGLQVVHAAGIGLDGDGLLLTARGGSGKSTTSLLCLEDGFGFAGDNHVVAECARPASGPDAGGTAPPPPVVCHSLYSSASLRPDNLHRLPSLRGFVRNEERLASEKALLLLHERAPERMLRAFRVRATLIPRVTEGTATRLVPARPGECLRALAPSSLFTLPGARGDAFARTAALARAVPCFHLLLGSDLPAIPRRLRAFLGELSR